MRALDSCLIAARRCRASCRPPPPRSTSTSPPMRPSTSSAWTRPPRCSPVRTLSPAYEPLDLVTRSSRALEIANAGYAKPFEACREDEEELRRDERVAEGVVRSSDGDAISRCHVCKSPRSNGGLTLVRGQLGREGGGGA